MGLSLLQGSGALAAALVVIMASVLAGSACTVLEDLDGLAGAEPVNESESRG